MSRSNLFSAGRRERQVFQDERYLYPEFIPDNLPHREKELESLAYCLRPILAGKKPLNVFLVGPTGVGKTVCAKYVVRELADAGGRSKSLYLNCFEFNSRVSVLISLANFLGAGIPRRGLATDEIFSNILEYLPKANFTPIVILDEVDQLLVDAEGQKLLYDLLRVIEYGKQRIGVIMISNDKALTSGLDSKIRSSLAEQTIVFDPYTPVQLKAILSERADMAFAKGSLDKDVVNVAAAHAAKLGGDARVAFEGLLKAGRIAESKNSEKVTVEHLNGAFAEVDSASLVKGVKHLDKEGLLLLKIIAQNQPVNSGAVYELYSKTHKGGLKQRRVREILSMLEKKNFVSAQEKSLGNQGKTRVFSSAIPKESLK